ncbi:hypothetical protein [Flavobacterium sp. GT3R68]|uniref:hypothetical protein n=1 Tax=Flavobacterium sp. GT3R68 TaxID=2594437 RepID=UPI000F8863A4|nr:hypothetical protein [Flavobacterium sp. GT3R68]RTY92414.1 hypothetical protein EKL32_17575 [Flavobacterium sp. GSN2]TRW92330.1 hypothetical protein FNW07_04790 [Flavobacterium sp. GT3R68]
MSIIEIKDKLLAKNILCSLFGHKFIITRNITGHFKEYECVHCHLELTNDEKGHKIFLTPEHREINETLISFYQKRHPAA